MKIKYKAETTGKAFHRSKKLVRGIRGAIGSGKSVMCVLELLLLAQNQPPNAQGIRKSRWGCIRNTYPELKSTVIKTFQDWIPDSICPIKYDAPISGKLTMPLADGTTVEAEFAFLALDKPKDVSKLMSFEFTGIWVNEAQFVELNIIREALSRCGRYPRLAEYEGTGLLPDDFDPSLPKYSDKKHKDYTEVEVYWSGIIMDTNSPDDSHWWYDLEQQNTPEGWEFFIQPGALIKERGKYIPNPLAENVRNHPKGFQYWLDLIPGNDENWIRSRVENKYATVSAGKPIYKDQFNEFIHIAKDELMPMRKHPIAMGFDFGLTPSCIIGQIMPTGQLRIIDELVAERMGLDNFLKEVIIPHLKANYPHHKRENIQVFGDPAGVAASDTDERTCFQSLWEQHFEAEPASTNKPITRWDSVRWFLSRLTAGQPAFLLSPTCKILKKGFISGYHFKQLNVSGETRYQEKADKNSYSHPHDALQYLCLGVKGETEYNDVPLQAPQQVLDNVTGY